jgi:hypothetical protein
VFELMTTVPLLALSLKSAAVVVPELVQYKVVPLETLVVVTVYVTLSPSLIDATLGDIAYVEMITPELIEIPSPIFIPTPKRTLILTSF